MCRRPEEGRGLRDDLDGVDGVDGAEVVDACEGVDDAEDGWWAVQRVRMVWMMQRAM